MNNKKFQKYFCSILVIGMLSGVILNILLVDVKYLIYGSLGGLVLGLIVGLIASRKKK